MHALCAREGQKCTQIFFLKKGNTCHTFVKVLKVVEIIYQNARAYIKIKVMGAWEGQKMH